MATRLQRQGRGCARAQFVVHGDEHRPECAGAGVVAMGGVDLTKSDDLRRLAQKTASLFQKPFAIVHCVGNILYAEYPGQEENRQPEGHIFPVEKGFEAMSASHPA